MYLTATSAAYDIFRGKVTNNRLKCNSKVLVEGHLVIRSKMYAKV